VSLRELGGVGRLSLRGLAQFNGYASHVTSHSSYDLPDLDDEFGENPYSWNQPGAPGIFRRWRALSDACGCDLTLVGEVWLPPAHFADYIRAGELTQVFNFDLLQQPSEGGAAAPAGVARFGLSVPGGGARQDPIWVRSLHTEHGRDGSRVPLPWRADATHYGFTDGEASPWLPRPDWFREYAVDRQIDGADSVLSFYRRAVRARRDLAPDAPLEWLEIDRDDALAYRRGSHVCPDRVRRPSDRSAGGVRPGDHLQMCRTVSIAA
jgi:hypothetical protein